MSKRSQDYQRGIRAYRAKDYDTARSLLLRFAEDGDDEARTMIGSMYQLGLGDLQLNDEEAINWYLLASRKGNGVATNNLGTIALSRGDRKAAIRYYERARKQGFQHAPAPAFVRKQY